MQIKVIFNFQILQDDFVCLIYLEDFSSLQEQLEHWLSCNEDCFVLLELVTNAKKIPNHKHCVMHILPITRVCQSNVESQRFPPFFPMYNIVHVFLAFSNATISFLVIANSAFDFAGVHGNEIHKEKQIFV